MLSREEKAGGAWHQLTEDFESRGGRPGCEITGEGSHCVFLRRQP